jgi:hypothetical protein
LTTSTTAPSSKRRGTGSAISARPLAARCVTWPTSKRERLPAASPSAGLSVTRTRTGDRSSLPRGPRRTLHGLIGRMGQGSRRGRRPAHRARHRLVRRLATPPQADSAETPVIGGRDQRHGTIVWVARLARLGENILQPVEDGSAGCPNDGRVHGRTSGIPWSPPAPSPGAPGKRRLGRRLEP